jgi:energy-coupling factor transport system permease protein
LISPARDGDGHWVPERTPSNAVLQSRSCSIRGLDPRVRIIGFVIMSTLPFIFNNPVVVGAEMIVAIGLALSTGAGTELRRVRNPLLVMMVLTFLMWQVVLPYQGDLIPVGPITIGTETGAYGLAVGLRLATLTIVGIVFLSVTPIEELTLGLVRLGLPFRVSFVISLTFRFIPMFLETAEAVLASQRARGLSATRGWRAPIRRVAPLLVPFVVSCMRRFAALALALEARGFRPGARRTSYLSTSFRTRDGVALVAMVALLAAAITARLAGFGVVLPARI